MMTPTMRPPKTLRRPAPSRQRPPGAEVLVASVAVAGGGGSPRADGRGALREGGGEGEVAVNRVWRLVRPRLNHRTPPLFYCPGLLNHK